MTRHQQAAAKAVVKYLAGRKEPVTLWSVSCVADEGARETGRKTELFPSLYDYGDLLPPDWKQRWLSNGANPGSDSLLMCCPPGWQEGGTNSDQLLLGAGPLVSTPLNFQTS